MNAFPIANRWNQLHLKRTLFQWIFNPIVLMMRRDAAYRISILPSTLVSCWNHEPKIQFSLFAGISSLSILTFDHCY
jgi:hypothetical protein